MHRQGFLAPLLSHLQCDRFVGKFDHQNCLCEINTGCANTRLCSRFKCSRFKTAFIYAEWSCVCVTAELDWSQNFFYPKFFFVLFLFLQSRLNIVEERQKGSWLESSHTGMVGAWPGFLSSIRQVCCRQDLGYNHSYFNPDPWSFSEPNQTAGSSLLALCCMFSLHTPEEKVAPMVHSAEHVRTSQEQWRRESQGY